MKKFTLFLAIVAGLSGCKKSDDSNSGNNSFEEIIYVQTNDFASGQNAVLAYRHTGDGQLTQIAGSPFKTGGTGIGNPMQALGPADSDYEIWMTADKKYLLVANSGSNNITVFGINADGSLVLVPGSPFASGGETPCSIYMADNYVYVVNKSDNPLAPASSRPNYTTFTLSAAGQLSPVAGAKVETTRGVSPSQTYISRDKKFAYGCDWLGFTLMPPAGTLRSFTNSNGVLTPIDTPMNIPAMGGALGLWQNPSAKVLYVGFALAGQVGVYNIDATTGKLSYQRAVTAGVAACWIRTNTSGSRLFVLNSGENSISSYNSSDAANPQSVGKLTLKNAGPAYDFMGIPLTTSEDFAFALSGDERFMYVVSQHTNKDFSIGNYNYLHVVSIAADGTMTEPTEPAQLPVANTLRPKGAIVYKIK